MQLRSHHRICSICIYIYNWSPDWSPHLSPTRILLGVVVEVVVNYRLGMSDTESIPGVDGFE